MKKKVLFLLAIILLPYFYFSYLVVGTGFYKNHQKFFYIKDGEAVFVDKKPAGWVSLQEVGKEIIWPIVLSEDWAFYQHSGIDWQQLKTVVEESVEKGQLTRGASTITQQLVKNLYLNSQRSLLRKINEFFITLFLEYKVKKSWILEQYLNVIELGDGIYGVREGSAFYFDKNLDELTYREGAFLAMLLPSPKNYNQSFLDKKLTPYARKQVGAILEKLLVAKIITPEQFELEKNSRFSWEQSEDESEAEESDYMNYLDEAL